MYKIFLINVIFAILLTTNASANFRTEVVDTSHDVHEMTDHSSAVDNNGAMHIAYGREDLFYATNKSGVWLVEQVDDVGGYTSLALDQQGAVHISYRGSGGLQYATNKSGIWQTEVVDNSFLLWVGHSSIGIDSLGNAHIAYSEAPCFAYCTTHGEHLYYSTNTSGNWVIETLNANDGTGIHPSLVIDKNDKVHISYFYYEGINNQLNYMTNITGTWNDTTVHTGTLGTFSSLSLDSLGNVFISSYDTFLATLNLSTNQSGTWQTETVDNAANVGEYTSIALDVNDTVHISYRDVTNSSLKYIHNGSGSWNALTLDNNGSIDNGTSIAIDRNGYIHISYYDDVNTTLKYATNARINVAVPLFGLPGVFLLIGLFGLMAIRRIDTIH